MPATAKTVPIDSYMKLIEEFPLRRLKTPAEHKKAIRIVIRLSTGKSDRGTREYLGVLVDLISSYEDQSGHRLDTSDLTAADLILHRIQERGMTVSQLAREIGIAQSNLSEMLSGKRDWSKAAIRAIAKKFTISIDRFF